MTVFMYIISYSESPENTAKLFTQYLDELFLLDSYCVYRHLSIFMVLNVLERAILSDI